MAAFAPPTAEEYDEYKSYGVNVISQRARQKAQQHRYRVDADIARRNHEARLQKETDDKRILKDILDEQDRLYKLSCHQNRNSALHIDQYEYDLERKKRLVNIHRLKHVRKKRSQIVAGSKDPVLKPVPLKPDTVYVGSNPVGYHVVPNKVMLAMAMNTKLVDDQLETAKRHKNALSKLIKRELLDTKNMFPTLLNDTAMSRPQKENEEDRRMMMMKSGLSRSQRSRPSSAMLWKSLDPLDPLPLEDSNKENNNNFNNNNNNNNNSSSNHHQRWANSSSAPHTMNNSPAKGLIRRPLSSPGPRPRTPSSQHVDGTGHLVVRPQSSPTQRSPGPSSPFVFVPVRQQRPTSPYLRFIQDVEKMSVRFDTPSVPLANPIRPHLPPIITILDVLPNYEL